MAQIQICVLRARTYMSRCFTWCLGQTGDPRSSKLYVKREKEGDGKMVGIVKSWAAQFCLPLNDVSSLEMLHVAISTALRHSE